MKYIDLVSNIKSGIYVIINDSDKKVDVRYTSNFNSSIATILSQIKHGYSPCKELIVDRDKLEFVFLETIYDKQLMLLRHAFWMDHYSNLGFKLYRKRPGMVLRPQVYIEGRYAYLRLLNRNHDGFVVGVWDNIHDANSFVEQYYSKPFPIPVYCINKLTKEYLGVFELGRKLGKTLL